MEIRCSISVFLFYILNRLLAFTATPSTKCFSCQGTCYNRNECNCQTGICEGDYCFSSFVPHKNRKYQIRKGCANQMPVKEFGCFGNVGEFDSVSECYCDHDFCNDVVPEQLPKMRINLYHNHSCYQCGDALNQASCEQKCKGDYCYLDMRSGQSSCGYGHINLPFHYRTSDFMRTGSGAHCMEYFQGGASASAFKRCVCNQSHCNHKFILSHTDYHKRRLFECYNCAISSRDPISPNSCRDQTCRGNFCILTLQTMITLEEGVFYKRSAGCLNTTGSQHVMTGCFQQWLSNKEESIECACRGNFCNINLGEAHKYATSSYLQQLNFDVVTLTLLLLFIF